MGSGIDKRGLSKSVYHLLVGLCTVAEARVRSETGNYDLIPANRDLAGAESNWSASTAARTACATPSPCTPANTTSS
jgi:cellulose biosynthesis protein BcsQ